MQQKLQAETWALGRSSGPPAARGVLWVVLQEEGAPGALWPTYGSARVTPAEPAVTHQRARLHGSRRSSALTE